MSRTIQKRFEKGSDNQNFQMEMLNVSSLPNQFAQLEHQYPAFIQTKSGVQDSIAMDSRFPKHPSDIQPLAETHVCSYEECIKFHSPGSRSDSDNPESPLKNVFFCLVLLMLLVWILAYVLLSRLDFL